ncbi:MAG: nucleotidyl transferase AbiEii/AbiGii toxin family protein [Gammaproteobacteria bacterium]|nr:nucleotidyl transferase AbiEii/AbiGii toxin family protein [Gammaproteobacteria bacterium]
MREHYQKQVALLLDVLPIIAKAEVFALKGGTAINFFFLDCPRLSVDIDLHYLPQESRSDALRDIHLHMQQFKAEIENSFPGTRVSINPDTYSAQVQSRDARIAIEPNLVIRGPLLPPINKKLCPKLEKEFGRSLSINCLAEEELYAGKFCAALDRQHPRDLFDVKLYIESRRALSRSLLDAFTVYLVSQDKQMHERLNPNRKDIAALFESNFRGMTVDDITLAELAAVQEQLPALVLASLSTEHRAFLVDFKSGTPDWSQLPYPRAQELPGVRWKQQNLEKMSAEARNQAIQKLKELFNTHPPHSPQSGTTPGAAMSEPTVIQNSQDTLADEIIQELIAKNLISSAKQKELKQKIASSTLKPEDWTLLIDLAAKHGDQGGING